MKVSKQKGEKLLNILNNLRMSKTTTQTATTASEFKAFSAKKIGANITVIGEKTDGSTERLSRKVTKEEGEVIIKKITLFNKKPSETVAKAIIKLTTPDAVKKKEEAEATKAKIKGLGKQIKKVAKEDKTIEGVKERRNILEELEELMANDSSAVDKLQALVNKFKKVETKIIPVAATSYVGRRGEH